MSLSEANKTDTVNDGKRKWMYPLVRRGKLYQYRSWLSYLYLILFFTAPYLRINQQPVLLLNVIERRFVLLGQVFCAQDIIMFVLAMLAFLVCIVLFTIAFGRIFCGWICPQTIFMEIVFRKIEIWIEGSPKQRRLLDSGAWTTQKVLKKAAKHTAFLALSFIIANTFLAYVIGSQTLLKIITEPVNRHWSGFASICIFTVLFYMVYSQVREIVCTVICPYGRLQGVLTDKHTLMVAYNYLRGEPRGKLKRQSDVPKGDCVDCGLCVEVCPTGIDIRKGTQLECINCTACIDACNHVMEKTGKPLNLIGFYSEEMIEQKVMPAFTGRMAAYSGVMVALLGVLAFFITTRSVIDITVMRIGGLLYQEQPGGYISNVYSMDLVNKTSDTKTVDVVADNKAIKIKYLQPLHTLEKEQSAKTTFFILIPAGSIKSAKTEVKLTVLEGGVVLGRASTTFIGPIN